jgi:hypothetical protein
MQTLIPQVKIPEQPKLIMAPKGMEELADLWGKVDVANEIDPEFRIL